MEGDHGHRLRELEEDGEWCRCRECGRIAKIDSSEYWYKNGCNKNRGEEECQEDTKRYKRLEKSNETLLAICDGKMEEERILTEKEREQIDNKRIEAIRKKRWKEMAERSRGAAMKRFARKTENIADEVRERIKANKAREEEEARAEEMMREGIRRRTSERAQQAEADE